MADHTTVHPRCEQQQHLIDFFTFQGYPRNSDSQRPVYILVNQGYVVGYCPNRLQSLWAAYRVAGVDRDVDYDRPHLYYEDRRLDADWQIGPQTFGKKDNIQYHVGHLVPNEVINRQFGRLAQMETFFMSNMSPQRGTLNTGVWLDLEDKIRNIEETSQKDHVWAIAGPVFDDNPDTLARPNGKNVPIPTAYYYITVDPYRYPWNTPSTVDVACFLIPQDADRRTPLDEFLVDLTTIEQQTRLKFFPGWEETSHFAGGLIAAESDAAKAQHRLLRQLY